MTPAAQACRTARGVFLRPGRVGPGAADVRGCSSPALWNEDGVLQRVALPIASREHDVREPEAAAGIVKVKVTSSVTVTAAALPPSRRP
jgi:hypothetical protein